MGFNKGTEEEFRELYKKLEKLSAKCQDVNEGREDESSMVYQTYHLHTESGRKFYNWIEDKVLLDILRQKASEINHSPSQKELYWVWRDYIKRRFRKWPYALEAAGLSRAAGAGGKTLEQTEADKQEYQMLLKEIREKAEELCRIPHPKDVPELREKLKNYTNNWNEVIKDAELDPQFFREKSVYIIENPEAEYRDNLEKLKALAEFLGRAPLKSELDENIRKGLIERFGSWRNALYQIGLEPVIRINPFSSTQIENTKTEKERMHKSSLHDCYYRVLNPDAQTLEDLDTLYRLKETLKHEPDKKEVSPELRKRLQAACGSWANALFQLEYRNKGKEN